MRILYDHVVSSVTILLYLISEVYHLDIVFNAIQLWVDMKEFMNKWPLFSL